MRIHESGDALATTSRETILEWAAELDLRLLIGELLAPAFAGKGSQ